MPASLAAESSSANLNEDGWFEYPMCCCTCARARAQTFTRTTHTGLMECLICFGVGIDALLLPCQHSGLCAHCAEAVWMCSFVLSLSPPPIPRPPPSPSCSDAPSFPLLACVPCVRARVRDRVKLLMSLKPSITIAAAAKA